MDGVKFKAFGVMGFPVDAEGDSRFVANRFDTMNRIRGKADNIAREERDIGHGFNAIGILAIAMDPSPKGILLLALQDGDDAPVAVIMHGGNLPRFVNCNLHR